MPRGLALASVAVVGIASLGVAARARADVPFATTPARIDGDRVVAAHREVPDPRDGGWGARRREARARARVRACALVHGFVDAALARTVATPAELSALHAAIDARCEAIATRPTVDGGAVVEVAVPLAALREAAAIEGAPW